MITVQNRFIEHILHVRNMPIQRDGEDSTETLFSILCCVCVEAFSTLLENYITSLSIKRNLCAVLDPERSIGGNPHIK